MAGRISVRICQASATESYCITFGVPEELDGLRGVQKLLGSLVEGKQALLLDRDARDRGSWSAPLLKKFKCHGFPTRGLGSSF